MEVIITNIGPPLWYMDHLIRKKEQLWVKIVCRNCGTFLGNKNTFLSIQVSLHTGRIANGSKFILRKTNVIPFTVQSTGNGLALRFKTNAVNFEVTYEGYQNSSKRHLMNILRFWRQITRGLKIDLISPEPHFVQFLFIRK